MHLSILSLAAMLPFVVVAYDDNKMLCLVNKARGENGLPNLGMDSRLIDAAQDHSNDMANMNSLSHYGSDGTDPSARVTQSGYNWLAVAENVANGAKDAQTCFKQLMNSPEHKANILGSQYTQFGSAVAYGGDGTPFYTQDFAAGGQNEYPACPGGDDDSSSSSSGDDSGSGRRGRSGKQGRHSFGTNLIFSEGSDDFDDGGGSTNSFSFGDDDFDDDGGSTSFFSFGGDDFDDGGGNSYDDDDDGGGGGWTWFTT
jgi:hypothetical protein